MEHYGDARGNLEVDEGEWDDEQLEEPVEDEKCNWEGEVDESVVGSNIEVEVAAEGSGEECKDSEESKMSVFSRDSGLTSLSWDDST